MGKMGVQVSVCAAHIQHHCTWGHHGCELPAACQSHSQGIWHLWAGLCERQKCLGGWEEMGKRQKGHYCKVWWQALGGRAGWQRECCSLWGIGDHGRMALFGAGAPWKGNNWGLPLLKRRVRGKEQRAEAIMLWPSGSSPPNTSLKDLGGTEQNTQQRWRDAETQKGRTEVFAWTWTRVKGSKTVSLTICWIVWFFLNVWMDYQNLVLTSSN